MRPVNPARGEVEASFGAYRVILRGSFKTLARLQGALNVTGLPAALAMVVAADPRALIEGLRCLAVDGWREEIGDESFVENYKVVQDAVTAAIMGPKQEADGEPDPPKAEAA